MKLIVGLPHRHSSSVVDSFRIIICLVMSPLFLSGVMILHGLIGGGDFWGTLLIFKSIEKSLK